MNDDVDLTQKLKLDGVHLGQSDMPILEARKRLGGDVMIGITCHNSRHLAMEACENGADYVAFGAFYATLTKDTPYVCDLDILTIWQSLMQTPCVAIGGITNQTAGEIKTAGADFIAVSSYVFGHNGGLSVGLKALYEAIKD
jgi:thiamine-phosphate pyrophosphorylase